MRSPPQLSTGKNSKKISTLQVSTPAFHRGNLEGGGGGRDFHTRNAAARPAMRSGGPNTPLPFHVAHTSPTRWSSGNVQSVAGKQPGRNSFTVSGLRPRLPNIAVRLYTAPSCARATTKSWGCDSSAYCIDVRLAVCVVHGECGAPMDGCVDVDRYLRFSSA